MVPRHAAALPLAVLCVSAVAAAGQQVGDTVVTDSGLRYVFTEKGDGPAPEVGDLMVIHGIGTLTDGTEFWNTRTDGSPYEYTFGVDRVIRGFEEGMGHVREGDRIIITMKPELAYGERDRPGIPANSTLVFDYEILKVAKRSVAGLLREGEASGTVEQTLERLAAMPDLSNYYVSEQSLQAAARRAGRDQPADGERILAFGLTLLPDSWRLHQALARSQAERGAAQEAIASYQTALRLNPATTEAERSAHEAAARALAELGGG